MTLHERQGVSNYRQLDCVTVCSGSGLYQIKQQSFALLAPFGGKPPLINVFPSQRASYAGSISISWHHHGNVALPLQWRHNGRDSVSNHQPHDCLLNRLFRRRSKKTSKLRVTGLCAGNSPGTGEFPAQMAIYAENFSIWWRHNDNNMDVQTRIREVKVINV